jgi:hypothetical protein
MVKAHVIVKDKKGKQVFTKKWETPNPNLAATKFSAMYPDCFVRVYYGKNEICLQPLNMTKDQKLVDSGLLSIGKFMTKWFGKSPGPRAMKKELIQEFGEDDIIL